MSLDQIVRRRCWYGPQTAAQISPNDPKRQEKLASALACIPESEGSASPQGQDPEDLHTRWPGQISELEESSNASPFSGDQSEEARRYRQRQADRHARNLCRYEQAAKLDAEKVKKTQRRQERKALVRERAMRLGLPSKSSKWAAAKRRREQNFKTYSLLTGGGQKAPRLQSQETEQRLALEKRMKAFDEAEKAKSQTRHWWEMMSDSDDDHPTRPARFRPSDDEAKSQHKKGKHKRKKSKREKHAKKAQKVRVDKTVETVDL